MDDRDSAALQVVRDALDCPAAERESFVAGRCGDDRELRRSVDALLLDIGGGDTDSANGSHDSAERADRDRAAGDGLIGARLGPFRVIDRIGRGGMGVVYRGQREEADFAQEVAIKLIRRGFDFDDVHARFLRERRILARLSHPNLAHFIDGGVSTDGRPWFALEYVRGCTITHWCDGRRLGLRDRVTLFLDVCAAVQHAHTQLVVHRDLKPGNILVDDGGAVRLLDFGVAGLLSGDGDDGARHSTISLNHALTPEYAAPEQFGGGHVGVAADIYALGIVLYELISGVRPYVLDRQDRASAERSVREQLPQSLLAAIRRDADQDGAPTSDVAAGKDATRSPLDSRLQARATTLVAYGRQVRGDLGRIIDKAIAKQASDRYLTVEAFAEDLSRWLAGAPVRATGNSAGYRIGKFVSRNRTAVAVAALLTVALLATTAWALHSAWQERIQRDAAVAEASRASAIREYLMLAFRDAAEQRDAAKLTARDVLKRGADAIFTQFADQPETGQTTALVMAELFQSVNDMESAAPLLERLIVWPGIERNPDILASARYSLAQVDYFLGKLPPAAELLAQAQNHWLTQPTRYADKLSESRNVQSSLLRGDGKFDEAIAVIEQGIAEWRALGRAPDRELGTLLSTATLALSAGARNDEAWQRGNEAVAVFEALGLASSPSALAALNNRAFVAAQLGKLDDAASDFRRIADSNRQLYGPSIGLASVLNNLASVLIRGERFADAIQPLEEALPMAIEFGGERGRTAIWPRVNLAETYAATGRIAEATALADSALEIAVADYGVDSVFAGIAHRAQAKLALARHDDAGARRHVDAASAIFTPMGKAGAAYMKGIDALRGKLKPR